MNIVWKITKMYVAPNAYEFPNVVISADWSCAAIDDQYSASQSNNTSFGNLSQPMTPYADLTQDQVLQWVWSSGVNKDDIERALIAQVNVKKNPPIITPPLPWGE